MSWFKSEPIIEKKKNELKILCPYCESSINKTLFKIVDSIDYEYGYEKSEVRLECCPHCNKLLGIIEW